MATIHPSRMALIAQQDGHSESYSSRRRSPSPARRRRSHTPVRSPCRDRSRSRSRSREKQSGSGRVYDKDREDRKRSGDNRGDDEGEKLVDRRGSPKYDDYSRPAAEPAQLTHGRHTENMYPNRRFDRGDDSYGGGGSDYLEARRQKRASLVVNVWPSSPKAPTRKLSPIPSKSRKKSKRARSPSTTSESSSEEDRRRRERKERKRSRKEKDRERRRHRSRSRSRDRRKSYDDDSEEDRRRRESKREKAKSSTRSRSRERLPSTPPRHAESEDEWVIKAPKAPPPVPIHSDSKMLDEPSTRVLLSEDEASENEEVGPQPPTKIYARRVDERAYGSALLRGEGSAMAAFLQDGTEARIPRRGEIGLTSNEIAKFEDVGYVMSGSRHRRMNAVRMRKENQVISAEEKRGILKLQRDERERRETILREEFGELVKERLKSVPEPKAT